MCVCVCLFIEWTVLLYDNHLNVQADFSSVIYQTVALSPHFTQWECVAVMLNLSRWHYLYVQVVEEKLH